MTRRPWALIRAGAMPADVKGEATMQNVKVKRTELLEVLTKNRGEHREVFLQGQVKFREAVIERLDAMLEAARAGRKIQQHVGLTAPEDHTGDYDRVIAMLGMSVDETITLSAHEFESYVMDRWQWARQFGATVAAMGISNKYEVSAGDDAEIE